MKLRESTTYFNKIVHDIEINSEPIEVDLENPIQEQITSLITNSSLRHVQVMITRVKEI